MQDVLQSFVDLAIMGIGEDDEIVGTLAGDVGRQLVRILVRDMAKVDIFLDTYGTDLKPKNMWCWTIAHPLDTQHGEDWCHVCSQHSHEK